jgi:phosphatidylinositol alpha 1,6-mannosyltransferase
VAADTHRGLLGEAARERAARRTWVDAVDELVDSHYRAATAPAPIAA